MKQAPAHCAQTSPPTLPCCTGTQAHRALAQAQAQAGRLALTPPTGYSALPSISARTPCLVRRASIRQQQYHRHRSWQTADGPLVAVPGAWANGQQLESKVRAWERVWLSARAGLCVPPLPDRRGWIPGEQTGNFREWTRFRCDCETTATPTASATATATLLKGRLSVPSLTIFPGNQSWRRAARGPGARSKRCVSRLRFRYSISDSRFTAVFDEVGQAGSCSFVGWLAGWRWLAGGSLGDFELRGAHADDMSGRNRGSTPPKVGRSA
ncbi:hypothetical protein QBC39DRAFT_340579 [Podospora conica]|nr:hypothetical protein QBC39DRAFT_340579 [Schizothecium conicum]